MALQYSKPSSLQATKRNISIAANGIWNIWEEDRLAQKGCYAWHLIIPILITCHWSTFLHAAKVRTESAWYIYPAVNLYALSLFRREKHWREKQQRHKQITNNNCTATVLCSQHPHIYVQCEPVILSVRALRNRTWYNSTMVRNGCINYVSTHSLSDAFWTVVFLVFFCVALQVICEAAEHRNITSSLLHTKYQHKAT